MQTLTIPIPEGFEIDSLDKSTGKITFREKKKDVFERINSLEDAIKELGESDEDIIDLRILLNCFPDEHYLVAQQKIVVLTKAFNEGWTPDWNNTNEVKYFPWFEMGGSSGFRFGDYVVWYSRSFVGSRLCFYSSKLAEHVGKKFTELYKDFMLLNFSDGR
jgi:hypothetical protein